MKFDIGIVLMDGNVIHQEVEELSKNAAIQVVFHFMNDGYFDNRSGIGYPNHQIKKCILSNIVKLDKPTSNIEKEG